MVTIEYIVNHLGEIFQKLPEILQSAEGEIHSLYASPNNRWITDKASLFTIAAKAALSNAIKVDESIKERIVQEWTSYVYEMGSNALMAECDKAKAVSLMHFNKIDLLFTWEHSR